MSSQGPESSTKKRQPGGVFILKGSKFGVTDIKISFGADGEPKIEAEFKIGLDMTDKWLSIAEQNTSRAIEAGRQLDMEWPSGDDSAAVPHLESEFFYSIQAVCASAFSIDAFYASVKEHIEIPEDIRAVWKKNRTSRASQIAEVLRRGFSINENGFQNLRSVIAEIFSLRDKAVHPSPKMTDLVQHPRLKIALAWHFVWFREENARNCCSHALSMISQLIRKPKPDNKKLCDYCSNTMANIDLILEAWESRYGKLFVRNNAD